MPDYGNYFAGVEAEREAAAGGLQTSTEVVEQPTPQINTADTYTDYFGKIKADREEQLGTVIDLVSKELPGGDASAESLVAETGMPRDFVDRNLDELRRRKRNAEAIKALRDSPTLSRMMFDPSFTKDALPDTSALASLERYMRGAGFSAVIAGPARVGAGVFDLFGFATDLMGLGVNAAREAAGYDQTVTIFDQMASDYQRWAGRAYEAVERGTPQAKSQTEAAVYSGLQSMSQNLLLLPLGLARTGTALQQANAALIAMSTMTGAEAYGTGKRSGLSTMIATSYGLSQGMIEYLTERLPAVKLFEGIGGSMGLAKLLAQQVATEAWTEQIATIGQDFNDWIHLHPDAPLQDYLDARPAAAYQTLIATIVGTVGQTAAIHTLQRLGDTAYGQAERTQRAQEHAERLQQAFATVGQTSLAPETLQDFIEQAAADNGKPQSLLVDAEVLFQFGKEMAPDVFSSILPSVKMDDLERQAAVGGTVEVSVAEVLARAQGTPLEEVLLRNSKTDPDGLTLAEAEAEKETAAEFIKTESERIRVQAEERQAWTAETDQVRSAIFDSLQSVGRWSADVNNAYATLQAAFYSTMAERIGKTPTELFQERMLRVGKTQQASGDVLSQASNQTETPEFKAWFGDSKVVDESGKPLVVYHGSRARFSEFSVDQIGTKTDSGYLGSGFYFGDRWHAGMYAGMPQEVARNAAEDKEWRGDAFIPVGQKGALYPVHLSMKNPLRLREQRNPSAPTQALDRDAHIRDALGLPATASAKEVTAAAQSAGYDGVIFEYENNGAGPFPLNVEYVVFQPNQIKSAIGNRGTFDPNDPNILRQGGDTPIATFSPEKLLITLDASSNLSSFFHESGHFFLEVMGGLASQPDAPADVVEMMTTTLEWFGVPDIATWNAMTLDEKRPYHEKFAEGFEQYLFEGKAPSVELQPMFRRFRSWMLSVYRSLKNFLQDRHLGMNREVRQVFDRLIATDDAIREAEQQAGMIPDDEATNIAIEKLQARSLQDLRWIVSAKNKALRKMQRTAKDLRKAIRAEVAAEVKASPIEQARAWLKETRKTQKNIPAIDLDAAAKQFGFTSGDHMTLALNDAPKAKEWISALTDQRMLERHGEFTSPEMIEQAANEAVHNEARARGIASEFKAQSEALGERTQVGVNSRGGRLTVNAIMAAAKNFAANTVAGKRIVEIARAIQQHRAAEAKSAKAWDKATRAAKTAEAIQAKRNQVLHSATTRALIEAQAEVQKLTAYLKKFDRDGVRKAIEFDDLQQIDRLLERVDLRKSTTKSAADAYQSLRAWVETQIEEHGIAPAVDPDQAERLSSRPYQDMTVEELRGLVDTVKSIEHTGRIRHKLIMAGKKQALAEAAGELVAEVKTNRLSGERPKLPGVDKGLGRWWRNFIAEHRKFGSFIRQFDGNNDNGAWWRIVGRGLMDRAAFEAQRIEQFTEQFTALLKPIQALDGGLHGGVRFLRSLGVSLTREERLAVMLNAGNGQNRQRLNDGNGIDEAALAEIQSQMTRAELKFVNDTWALLDSFWPEIAAQSERLKGVTPERVEALPFEAISSEGERVSMRGGYYPIAYDRDKSRRQAAHQDAQIFNDMRRGAYTSAQTRNGHEQKRKENVKEALRLDLMPIPSHATQVIHSLAWQEWLIDTNRLMRREDVSSAIRDYYGPEYLTEINKALTAIAVGELVNHDATLELGLFLRNNVSRSVMGFSMTTAMLQPFGILQSVVRIGRNPVMQGLGQMIGNTARVESTMKMIAAKSVVMRLRGKTFNREIFEIANKLRGKSAAAEIMDGALFITMRKMQLLADMPTWLGKYNQVLEATQDEDEAIAQADRAVIDSQGGGQLKDLSRVQRTHPFLTMFYSYFNTTLNLAIEQTAQTNFKNPASVAGWLSDMAMLMVIPALGPTIVLSLLRGDDDDPEEIAKNLAQAQASYMLGLILYARELSGVAQGYEYAGPPVARIVSDIYRAGQQTAQGETDEALVLAYARLLGSGLGLPTTQLIRSYRGWQAWEEGDAPPGAILFGPPPKD